MQQILLFEDEVENVEHFIALDSQSRKVKGETSSQKNEVNRQHIHVAFINRQRTILLCSRVSIDESSQKDEHSRQHFQATL